MTSKKHLWFLKYFLMVALLLFLYVLQTTPRLFAIAGVKPILVVPAAVCIAMFEGDLTGGIMGALAGLLCDLGSFTLFGFNGLIVMACCGAVALLTIYLTQLKLTNALLLGFGTLLLRGLLEYFFYFQMWGYENVHLVFWHETFPTVLYSTLMVAPLFYLVRRMNAWFDERLKI